MNPKAAGVSIKFGSGNPTRTIKDQVRLWTNHKWSHKYLTTSDPKYGSILKLPGLDSYTSGGIPGDVAPPLGWHGNKPNTYREGSYHQKGRAVDISGGKTFTSANSLGYGSGGYKKYQSTQQGPAQKWIRENGQKYNWYSYWNEIWHFNYKYDGAVTP